MSKDPTSQSVNDESGGGPSSFKRYDGLDSFRVFGIYGVVVYHFYYECVCANASVEQFMRLRDCTFPFIILTSFFVFARSIWNNPQREFRYFATSRFKRIEIPFLIWTAIYWAIWGGLRPLIYGEPLVKPPATLILSGYMHLWFLQFIFLGSIILFPFIRFLPVKRYRWIVAVVCFAIALAHVVWLKPILDQLIYAGWVAEADLSFRTFLANVSRFFIFIPAAIVIALFAEEITALYKYRAVRIISLVMVAVAIGLHFGIEARRVTRVIYSLAVFVAVLQPWPASLVNLLRPLAMYSYPVYILHFLVSRVLASILQRAQIESTSATILIGSVAVFGLSLLCAVVIRKFFPWDWLLPLTPVPRRQAHSVSAAPRVRYAEP